MVSALVLDSTMTRDLGTRTRFRLGVDGATVAPRSGGISVVPRGIRAVSNRSRPRSARPASSRLSRWSCGSLTRRSRQQLIRSFGTIGLILIIFAESGLLFGFFLPGDSLLFTAGLLAAQGRPEPRRGARRAASWPRSSATRSDTRSARRSVRRSSSGRTPGCSSRSTSNGPTSSSRSTAPRRSSRPLRPVVRTFVPILAGVGTMQYRTFLAYNVLGGLLWAVGVTLLGYFLGDQIGADNIDKYLLADHRRHHRHLADPPVARVLRTAARQGGRVTRRRGRGGAPSDLHDVVDE